MKSQVRYSLLRDLALLIVEPSPQLEPTHRSPQPFGFQAYTLFSSLEKMVRQSFIVESRRNQITEQMIAARSIQNAPIAKRPSPPAPAPEKKKPTPFQQQKDLAKKIVDHSSGRKLSTNIIRKGQTPSKIYRPTALGSSFKPMQSFQTRAGYTPIIRRREKNERDQ